MGLREDLQAQLAEVQGQLAILDNIPEDTFNFGTVLIYAPATGAKAYYVKTGEEIWTNIKSGLTNDLASIIFNFKTASIGYFEIYEMRAESAPIYASD